MILFKYESKLLNISNFSSSVKPDELTATYNLSSEETHSTAPNKSLFLFVPFVKPINKEQLINIVKTHPAGLITIEEHQSSCGMGSAIVEVLNDLYYEGDIEVYPKVKRIAIPDEFADVVGTQVFLREHEGLKL